MNLLHIIQLAVMFHYAIVDVCQGENSSVAWTDISSTSLTPMVDLTPLSVINQTISALTNKSTNASEVLVWPTSIQPNITAEIPTVKASLVATSSNDTSTDGKRLFVEFKLTALQWSSALTNKDHNTFIYKANEITQMVDSILGNVSSYVGSRVLGFREGVYVTVKLEFSHPVNLSLLDPFIVFLRAGGDTLKTDEVYLKLSRHADCIIAYVDTVLCNCESRTYKRQIVCTDPDVLGGFACPPKCKTGEVITGRKSCSWDHMDEALCVGHRDKPLALMIAAVVLLVKLVVAL